MSSANPDNHLSSSSHPASSQGIQAFRVPSGNSPAASDVSLGECVEIAMGRYFDDLSGFPADGLYNLVLHEVERPLLLSTLKQVNGNQTQAAKLLGISRSTLRNKLAKLELE